ncbi:MAG TPA: PfkB family carbohydrate kinase [Actinomycetota bacterium]|jgi:ribokinase
MAVVGHVEWIEFVRVERVPRPGDIVHASQRWELPGGGGAVAAVQLAKLAGGATLFTAFGDDELGHRAHDELSAMGLRVESTYRPEPQRRGFVFIDADGERTITVIGDRLGPAMADPLPWEDLASTAGVYFTAGDDGALRASRSAGAVVATSRVFDQLARAGVALDALVASGRDRGERFDLEALRPPPSLVVLTEGGSGGTWQRPGEEPVHFDPAPLPGPGGDAYGAGDSFAAGLTFGLASRMASGEAVALAAKCGAACRAGTGPYETQLRLV